MDLAILYVVLGACAGGFVQGLSGFAFGLVAMAFWAWWIPPQLAGPMVVFGSLIGQLVSIGAVRDGFEPKRVSPFVFGGLLGVPPGVALLHHIDRDLFGVSVGALLSVYCPMMLFAHALPRIEGGGRLADGMAGFAGGVMGGLGGFTGPAPTLWCTLRGWSKDVQRAVFQSFNLVMHALTLIFYWASGLISAETLRMFALIVPAMLIPNLLGTRLYARLSEALFRRLVLILLAVSGLALLISSLGHLMKD
jgi:uncharacterized membrane protein YfcA